MKINHFCIEQRDPRVLVGLVVGVSEIPEIPRDMKRELHVETKAR